MDIVNRNQAEEIVDAFYRGFLKREADAPSREHFVTALGNGLTVSSLVQQFLASAEFAAANVQKGLWVPAGHFYSPVVDPTQVSGFLDKVNRTVPTLPDLRIERDVLLETWRQMLPSFREMPFTAEPQDGYRYFFNNHSYSWADGSVLHAMIRFLKPETIIEVGSGNSSACALDTVDRFLGGRSGIRFIEPNPDLLKGLMGPRPAHVRVIQDGVQNVAIDMFTQLKENDILLIDSTHVMKTGSDVCFELFEILPRLAPGVVVHFHDVFWPFEYPRPWVIDENRSWNEIYGLRAFLTSNEKWEVIFFNDYFARFEREVIERDYPDFMKNTGGALWLRKK